MKNLNRRQFLGRSAAGVSSVVLLPFIPNKLFATEKSDLTFGFQSWTIREKLVEDFSGTMKKMANWGYSSIEMCSPLGYKDAGFGLFNKMKTSDLRNTIEDSGLVCESAHYNFGELKESLDNRIEWSKEMGIKQVILSSFWLPEPTTLDDYRKACDELNVIAQKINKAGLKTGFHNHNMEFAKIDGQLIYDVIMAQLDPELVKMQFQVAVIDIGYKAADYFKKYPGRFISAHLADWSPATKKQVALGQGVVEWDELFEAAKIGGVQNFFVEMDPAVFEQSAQFLKSL